MRKDIYLPVLALAGGIGGFFLRRWQLASAYDPEAGLFTYSAPATLALLGLMVLLVLVFALSVQHKGGAEDFLPTFRCPEAGQMAAYAAAWLLMARASRGCGCGGPRRSCISSRSPPPSCWRGDCVFWGASACCVWAGWPIGRNWPPGPAAWRPFPLSPD